MNQDKVLKIIKGLNRFSPDDIEIMTGFDTTQAIDILEKFLSAGLISRLSESEYRYINKIPERRGIFKLVEKPQRQPILDRDINFKQAAQYFIAEHAKETCTPSSLKTYISITRVHLIPFFGKIKLKNITQNNIKDFIELKQKQNLSNRRVRNCVTLFGNMFNKFKEWGFVLDSPYNGIINVKFSKEMKIRVLNESEVDFILKASKSNSLNLYHFILLGLSAGLKKAEIFALTKEDIDLKIKKININKTLFEGEIILPKSKTNFRKVDIFENIIPDLKQALKNKQENDFIFYDTRSSFFTQEKKIRYEFNKILKVLNLEKFTFNELRHTYAYNAVIQGMSIDYLHKQLGDYSIQATMDKYRNFII